MDGWMSLMNRWVVLIMAQLLSIKILSTSTRYGITDLILIKLRVGLLKYDSWSQPRSGLNQVVTIQILFWFVQVITYHSGKKRDLSRIWIQSNRSKMSILSIYILQSGCLSVPLDHGELDSSFLVRASVRSHSRFDFFFFCYFFYFTFLCRE